MLTPGFSLIEPPELLGSIRADKSMSNEGSAACPDYFYDDVAFASSSSTSSFVAFSKFGAAFMNCVCSIDSYSSILMNMEEVIVASFFDKLTFGSSTDSSTSYS